MTTNTTPMDQTEPQEEVPANLTCEQFWNLEQKGERPTVLDVREEHEWNEGHIDWATHLPLGKIETDAEAILPNKNETIITCCALGGRGEQAAAKLKEMGYSNVKNLSGGYTGYCAKDEVIDDEAEEREEEDFFAN